MYDLRVVELVIQKNKRVVEVAPMYRFKTKFK